MSIEEIQDREQNEKIGKKEIENNLGILHENFTHCAFYKGESGGITIPTKDLLKHKGELSHNELNNLSLDIYDEVVVQVVKNAADEFIFSISYKKYDDAKAISSSAYDQFEYNKGKASTIQSTYKYELSHGEVKGEMNYEELNRQINYIKKIIGFLPKK